MRIHLLEYYVEMGEDDSAWEIYNLIGVYFSEEETQKAKKNIALKLGLKEEHLYVSETNVGKIQWEGGFVTV